MHVDLRRMSKVPPVPVGRFRTELPVVDQHAVLQGVGLAGCEDPIPVLSRIEIDEHVFFSVVHPRRPNSERLRIIEVVRVRHEEHTGGPGRRVGNSTHVHPPRPRAIGVALVVAARRKDRRGLVVPLCGGPQAEPLIAVFLDGEGILRRRAEDRRKVDQPHLLVGIHVPALHLPRLFECHLLFGGPRVDVVVDRLKPGEYVSFRALGDPIGPHRALSLRQVPEIDLAPLKFRMGPGIPNAVVVVMVGRLDAGKHRSFRRPQRVNVAAPTVNLVDPFGHAFGLIPVFEHRPISPLYAQALPVVVHGGSRRRVPPGIDHAQLKIASRPRLRFPLQDPG